MNLSNYISDLLYRYECIILPGLGAFLTQNKPAYIDDKTNTFFPPAKTLSFNRHLQTNDGLLANHIAKTENITYEAALFRLRAEVKTLKSNLEKGETISIPAIGSLKTTRNSNLEFIPETSTNFLTEAFGLSSFVSSKVSREIQKKKEEEPALLFTPQKRSIPYLKYAAIGLLAIGLSSMAGVYLYNTQVTQHNIVEKQKANSLVENQIQQATFVVNTPLPSLTLEVKKPAGNYHLIAGAFRMEENALTKIDQLKEKGYPARTIGINKYGLHQVVYNSFESRDDALKSLREVKLQDNKDAWLLVQELD
ncbi:MAG: SPOR domain-containing protein [Flavobacteriaceae bacterium]